MVQEKEENLLFKNLFFTRRSWSSKDLLPLTHENILKERMDISYLNKKKKINQFYHKNELIFLHFIVDKY